MCLTCGRSLCKTQFHVSANITQRKITGMQKFSMIPDIYSNISFKNVSLIIIDIDIKKLIYASCLFDSYLLKGLQSVGGI